ncbi:MAG TPA: YbjN domain-containing protein [Marmoricola sp.]|nr:YbjN domain-containing protein [Marmoricola sp.]HNI71794.1 YbjN domain-containing protein [Marmoricola sp.]
MTPEQAIEAIAEALRHSGLDWTRTDDRFEIELPGERKLRTPCRITVGPHALDINAFVCRRPDENFEGTYRWMLERNLRMFGLAFGLDPLGDIYLSGRLPLMVATADEIDRILGSVLEYADSSFNVLLELGFASAIRKEWQWRVTRGESTANLAAFVAPLGLEESAGEEPEPSAEE